VAPDLNVERVLVITAHPDDVDFGVAGSVATWTDAGIQVTYCLATSGEAGGSDRSISRAEVAELRQVEQTAAAKVVGVEDLVFLGHPDGRLQPTLELRRDVSRVIRQVRPQRVITQSPDRNYERIYASHPDHLAAGEAALCAVYPDARNPFAHPELLEDEGLEPWSVAETWLMAAGTPNRFVDVTDTFDRKMDALRSHASQHSDWDPITEMIRGWLTATGKLAGFPDGRLAEGFFGLETG
jgi:LmbE family N-acetylglucosaminyl deacetylase